MTAGVRPAPAHDSMWVCCPQGMHTGEGWVPFKDDQQPRAEVELLTLAGTLRLRSPSTETSTEVLWGFRHGCRQQMAALGRAENELGSVWLESQLCPAPPHWWPGPLTSAGLCEGKPTRTCFCSVRTLLNARGNNLVCVTGLTTSWEGE